MVVVGGLGSSQQGERGDVDASGDVTARGTVVPVLARSHDFVMGVGGWRRKRKEWRRRCI